MHNLLVTLCQLCGYTLLFHFHLFARFTQETGMKKKRKIIFDAVKNNVKRKARVPSPISENCEKAGLPLRIINKQSSSSTKFMIILWNWSVNKIFADRNFKKFFLNT